MIARGKTTERAARRACCAALIVAFAFVATFVARTASAHLMPAKQGTLNVVDDAVFAVLSVPVSTLHDFDDDHDGRLDGGELQAHGEALRAELDRRFVITDGEARGRTLTLDLVLSPEHDAAVDRAAQVVVLKHVQFAAPVGDLRVRCDLFGARDEERQLTLTATRHPPTGAEVEAAILTPLSPSHRFYRPALAALGDTLRNGVEHVPLGTHLLLLLTVVAVVAAGVGVRFWRVQRAVGG